MKSKNIVARQHITELIPSSGRRSFYGKARVVHKGSVQYLVSYDTVVASCDENGFVHRHSDWKSHTTCCHVKSFIKQFAGKDSAVAADRFGRAKKDFWDLPVEERESILLEI